MRYAWVLGVLLVSCMPASHRKAKRLEGRYEVGVPEGDWRSVRPGGADHAWLNDTVPATLYTDSNCGPRFQDLRPEDLASEIVAGLYERDLLRDEARPIGDGQGVLRVHRGKLDGVEVQVAVLTFNRDPCTYDFALIARPEHFDECWGGFESVINGFRVP